MVGHLDLIRLFRPEEPFNEETWAAAEAAVAAGIANGCVFEINASGLRKGLPDPYPQRRLTKVCCDLLQLVLLLLRSESLLHPRLTPPHPRQYILANGGRLTLSDDSHAPSRVANYYMETRRFLEECGVIELHVLERVEAAGECRWQAVRDWAALPFWASLAQAQEQ